jgi:hypothetical protein
MYEESNVVEKWKRPLPHFQVLLLIAVWHPVTQVKIAHMGCVVFDDEASQLLQCL